MVVLKEFFKKNDFEKNQQAIKKHAQFSSNKGHMVKPQKFKRSFFEILANTLDSENSTYSCSIVINAYNNIQQKKPLIERFLLHAQNLCLN